MNPTLVLRLYPYYEISNFTFRRTHCKPDTGWMTANTPLMALLTVYELVCVVALTYWVKRTHRVDPGHKLVFSLYPKSYSIVKMCTWGLKYKKSIYTKWTIYCFCKLHRSLWNCVPIIGIIFVRLSLVHYHMQGARCFKLIFFKSIFTVAIF